MRHLRQEDKKSAFAKATILIADELTLSQMTLVSHENLVGIALQSGGVTSHTAILARAFEIPTVVGVEHLMESVTEGDALVLDGNSGIVYVNPSSEVEREYQLLMKRYDAFRKELMVGLDEPTVTRDGHRVEMLANIALPADIALAIRYGAEGIGLLRSEFSFLTYEDFPDEDQQLTLYTRMLEAAGQAPGDDSHARYRRRQVSAVPARAARGKSVPRMAIDSDLARDSRACSRSSSAPSCAPPPIMTFASCSR